MTTLLITATVFDDRTWLAYSFHFADRPGQPFSPTHQCEAGVTAWAYVTRTLFQAYGYEAVRVSVIDRRPGTRATSRSGGHSLTAAR